MDEKQENLSPKEIKRRQKISIARKKAIAKKREQGYRAWLRRKRKEMAKREKEKERERLRKKKERERKKNTRRVGRPKKRGPNKKYKRKKPPKYNPRNTKPPYIYKIVSCRNGKQNKFIGRYRTSEEAYEVFNRLKDNEKNIVFPAMIALKDRLDSSVNEYLLIEKTDGERGIFRNEYGKLVEQEINIEGWQVMDKFRYSSEETFWVWGYDKITDRKTFAWIYENIVLDGIYSRLDHKRVILYRNKIVLKDDNGYMDLIFCKHESDGVRFYNKLLEWAKKDKIKQLMFLGDYEAYGPRRKKLEEEIAEFTGWTKKKVQMRATTYYMVK